jgi:hypothetical protein
MPDTMDPTRPFAAAAALYPPTGFGMPVPLNGKIILPSNATGEEGSVSMVDVDRWIDRYPSSNIGLVLDDTVVAIDVDHGYAGHDGRVKHGADTLREFESRLGRLPATVTSTSRHAVHPDSRIRYYRVTTAEGMSLRGNIDLRTEDGSRGDVEVIHHRYRYVAAWPSVHPDTGEVYRWYDAGGNVYEDGALPVADQLPDLPSAWTNYLLSRAQAKGSGSYGVATDAEVDGAMTDGEPDAELTEFALRFWQEEISHGIGDETGSDLLGMTKVLARMIVAAKKPGGRKALAVARAGYVRKPYDNEKYRRAFDAAFAGSVKFWIQWEAENAVLRGAMFGEQPEPTAAVAGPAAPAPEAASAGAGQPISDAATPAHLQGLSSDLAPTPAGPDPSNAETVAPSTPSPHVEEPHEETEAEALLRRKIEDERIRLRVNAEAKRLEAEAAGATVELPRKVRLTEFLAEPDEDPEWRFEELWPTGGNILLAAQFKAGKSTMIGNIVRSLADGDDFLDRFAAEQARVVVIDDELDPRTWRRWLRDQGVRNTDAIELISLRGRTSTFDVLDPSMRARWAEHIAGADVLLFDCLRPVLDGLGLSEDKEAGRFLVGFDALKAEAGISESIMVHHMGHGASRSRGDSRLLDWPDANWRMLRPNTGDDDDEIDPSGPREFEAYGRDVAIPRTVLEYEQLTRHLSLGEGRAQDPDAEQIIADVLSTVRGNPGISKNALEKALSGQGAPYRRAALRKVTDRLVADARLVLQPMPGRAMGYLLPFA